LSFVDFNISDLKLFFQKVIYNHPIIYIGLVTKDFETHIP
jgi:hypothetical protein